jgi:biopolymer transport protein ExbB/TolQ
MAEIKIPTELKYEVGALLIAIVLVHLFYIAWVRPHADATLADEARRAQAGESFKAERTLWIVIRDYEQEAVFILGLWSLSMMVMRGHRALYARTLLDRQIIPVSEGMSILPEDAREYARPIEAMPDVDRQQLLPRALLASLDRFAATRDVQDVAAAAETICDAEADRLDSEMSMIRYIAWAIPAIGFIGTVRGIGESLTEAYKAAAGDVSGVTQGLGVAFNSTFIALSVSILLMFFLHQLQLVQERLVLDTRTYIDQKLIRHLRVR